MISKVELVAYENHFLCAVNVEILAKAS
jgi:hypothetical protein